MSEINLIDFFKYWEGTAEQVSAIDLLQEAMPATLKRDKSAWVVKFREAPPAPDPSNYFTPEMMGELTGYSPDSFDSVFCNDCNRLFAETGFADHLDAAQMLMANMMHETCNFKYMKEIADGWAYEGRSDLGNTQAGDGPKYKGAGVLQLTGRHNYQRLANGIGDQRVMEGVDYVSDTYPFTSAKIWIEENNLLSICLNQGFESCCVRINGGHNGYNDRVTKYRVCQRVMN